MYVFFKECYFSIVLSAIYLFSNSVSTQTGGGGVRQRANRCGQGEGGGMKTGKNVGTPLIDNPLT